VGKASAAQHICEFAADKKAKDVAEKEIAGLRMRGPNTRFQSKNPLNTFISRDRLGLRIKLNDFHFVRHLLGAPDLCTETLQVQINDWSYVEREYLRNH
jgi:hypothetical protein